MNRVLIIGGGDLAKQINHHLSYHSGISVIGFVDDTIGVDEVRFNQRCIGALSDIPKLFANKIFDQLICGIGYKHLNFRKKLLESLNSYPFYSFIHNSAIIDQSVRIGKGVFISPGVILEQNVVIGNNVFIYSSATVSHDSIIGSNNFLAPKVAIAGFVTIGDNCNIGINSTIIDNIYITDNVQTGGGAVVINSIVKSGLYVGNPARFLK